MAIEKTNVQAFARQHNKLKVFLCLCCASSQMWKSETPSYFFFGRSASNVND